MPQPGLDGAERPAAGWVKVLGELDPPVVGWCFAQPCCSICSDRSFPFPTMRVMPGLLRKPSVEVFVSASTLAIHSQACVRFLGPLNTTGRKGLDRDEDLT